MLIRKTKIPFKEIAVTGFLPSFVKKMIYRFRGYKIGSNVFIGYGSVILGRNVEIRDHVKIGFFSVIRGDDIHIDRFVTVGSMTMIDSLRIEIGEDARINENVIIGGMKTPSSCLKLGKRTIIMEYSFINTTLPIEIGDDTGIGGHCLLFTHGSWLNQLDGFPVTFAPIKLGKNVWLPWRVFIMPGVEIGDNVVIGANSLIAKSLPSNVLAAGSPARIIKENYPEKPDDDARDKILESIFKDFMAHLTHNDYTIQFTHGDSVSTLLVTKKNKTYSIVYSKNADAKFSVPVHDHLLILDHPALSIRFPDARMIIDLQQKTRIGKTDIGEEFTKFISRYGIRLQRLD